jgi:hypothetical protein
MLEVGVGTGEEEVGRGSVRARAVFHTNRRNRETSIKTATLRIVVPPEE